MRVWLAIAALMSALVAAPVQACMASGPDGLTHGLIWKSPQSDVPENAMLLKVELLGSIQGVWLGFQVKVEDGPQEIEGAVITVFPEAAHSCIGFGSSEGWLVVRREREEVPINGNRVRAYAAVEYEPSYMNEFLRFFGGAAWRYPGRRGPGSRLDNCVEQASNADGVIACS